MSNWTARFEYRYTNYSAYENAAALLFPGAKSEQDPDFHMFGSASVLVRVSRRLGGLAFISPLELGLYRRVWLLDWFK